MIVIYIIHTVAYSRKQSLLLLLLSSSFYEYCLLNKCLDSDDLIRFSCKFSCTTVVLLLPQIEIRGRFHACVEKHIKDTSCTGNKKNALEFKKNIYLIFI